VVAALILAPLGSSRVDSMFQWWLQRPMAVLRAWFAAAIPFGLFLAYVGI
jgi:threonine/homoserine efflux transporter RhtA